MELLQISVLEVGRYLINNYLLTIPLFAVLNRARGSQLGGLISSTGICHIIIPLLMALMVVVDIKSLIITWGLLIFWCVFAWDRYWELAGGVQVNSTGCKPIDWILSKMSIGNTRLEGIVGMGLRQGLFLLPVLLYLGKWKLILIPFLFGLPYYMFSFISPNFVMYSEVLIGAVLGGVL